MDCAHCDEPLPPPLSAEERSFLERIGAYLGPTGEWRRFCSARCRSRAYRRRRAGLPENAYSGERGAARGQVRLAEPTRAEQAAAWRELAAELRATTAELQ